MMPWDVPDPISSLTDYPMAAIESPVLNITAFYFAPDSTTYGRAWIDPDTNLTAFQNPKQQTFFYPQGNSSFQYVSADIITLHGTCQTIQGYEWGFSFILLFALLVLLLIWAISTAIIWACGNAALEPQERCDVSGDYKAIIELATTLQSSLDEQAKDVTALTEKQLKEYIEVAIQGGSIPHYASTFRAIPTPGILASKLLQTAGAWWLVSAVVLLGITIGILSLFIITKPKWKILDYDDFWLSAKKDYIGFNVLMFVAFTGFLGVIHAMFLGRTAGSRSIVVTIWVLLGLVIALSVGFGSLRNGSWISI